MSIPKKKRHLHAEIYPHYTAKKTKLKSKRGKKITLVHKMERHKRRKNAKKGRTSSAHVKKGPGEITKNLMGEKSVGG